MLIEGKNLLVGFVLCLLLGGSIAVAKQTGDFATPSIDAPELAHRGPYSVGFKTLDLVNPKQPDIARFNFSTMNMPVADRVLKILLWYPAEKAKDTLEPIIYQGTFPPDFVQERKIDLHYTINGQAMPNAKAKSDEAFPLIVLSHGFNNTAVFFSYLTENLASKGYVVAAIEHRDFDIDKDIPYQIRFAGTLLNRSKDQLFVLSELPKWLAQHAPNLAAVTEHETAALIGYSMGGFGLMSSLGAGLSEQGQLYNMIPGQLLSFLLEGSEALASINNESIKAAIALAPWGAQKPYRSWSKTALGMIDTPLLFIAGDNDDISQYEDGVKWLFEHSINSDRYLLVYQNARHNIGGNPSPVEAGAHYELLEYFDEPVWRKDRINAINQHFITAFLDWHLKGDASKGDYFRVDTPIAANGKWPVSNNNDNKKRYSGGISDPSNTYWKGFQRRSALGLELQHHAPKQSSSILKSAQKEVE